MTNVDRDSAYDSFAVEYARHSDTNIDNAHYERPASLELLGDLAGRRVLDAGCGPGTHTAAMMERGALVTGLDDSAGMLVVARERLGPDVPLHKASLSAALPFPDNAFDVVLSSLVLHHIRDWRPTIREFHRVLVPGGRLVASTHHPFVDHEIAGGTDYFATYEWEETWSHGDPPPTMQFWHRPLHEMIDIFRDAGFAIDRIKEPLPVPGAEKRFPDRFRQRSVRPHWIFFALVAAG